MSVTGSLFFDEVCQRGSIHEADVQKLRALYYEDGDISRAEAEALVEIHHACRIKDPAWQDFYIEAITDFLVGSAKPRGYINVDNADWLIEQISRDGVVESQTELEILIRVIDKARWSPESLVRFALNAVKDAVLTGDGRLRCGQKLKAGVVTDGDVELLRRIVMAFGGAGGVAVTRAEAQILFEINDATADASDNPAWTEFFVKALAGTVMAASGYSVPPRDVALARQQWLDSRGDLAPGGFIKAMLLGGDFGIYDWFSRKDAQDERELQRLERERRAIVTAEEVTDDEAAWLVAQIYRDGELTYNEKCLLAYLQAENPKLHPTLTPLLERVPDTV